MTQTTLSDALYAGGKRKQSRRETFLAKKGQAVPWDALLALMEPPILMWKLQAPRGPKHLHRQVVDH